MKSAIIDILAATFILAALAFVTGGLIGSRHSSNEIRSELLLMNAHYETLMERYEELRLECGK